MTPPRRPVPLRPATNRPLDNRAAMGGVLDVLLKPLLGAFNPPPCPLGHSDLPPVPHVDRSAAAAAKRARRRERNKAVVHGG